MSCEVRYDGLRVPVGRRIGEEGKGFRYLLDGLNPERILIASEALGIGEAALRQGGRTTPTSGSSSAARSVRTRASRSRWPRPTCGCTPPSWRSARRRGGSTRACRAGEAANTAKYLAAEAAFFAADRAMQTHGGLGYAREYHVERYWREARLMKIAPVSQEMVCNYISSQGPRPAQVVLTK